MSKSPDKNGTSYPKDCPPKIVSILEAARLAFNRSEGYRLRIYYGDPTTGKPWGNHPSEHPCGYIGRTCGPQIKSPIILPHRSSMGGHIIIADRIVKIEHANKKNGSVLYDITPSS
jgi:hypothetical protein